MATTRITLQEIADELGVSKVTVSRALKGQSGVGENLRRRVLKASQRLGYIKEKLRNEVRTRRLVFVTPRRYFLATDNFYQTIYSHINNRCHESAIDLSVFIVSPEDERDAKLPSRLGEIEVDGLFLGGEMARAFIDALAVLGPPLVSIDFGELPKGLDCVVADNFRLGEAAASYLVSRGYSRIGFVGGRDYSSNVADRYYGYKKVIDQSGLAWREDWILDNADRRTGHYTLDYPLPDELPEAFICHCDMAAYYLIQRLRKEGCAIPRDVAVMSFDNTELAAACEPALTSVDISKSEFAAIAYRLLDERISGYSGPERRIYLDSAIVERDSVPPKGRPAAAGNASR